MTSVLQDNNESGYHQHIVIKRLVLTHNQRSDKGKLRVLKATRGFNNWLVAFAMYFGKARVSCFRKAKFWMISQVYPSSLCSHVISPMRSLISSISKHWGTQGAQLHRCYQHFLDICTEATESTCSAYFISLLYSFCLCFNTLRMALTSLQGCDQSGMLTPSLLLGEEHQYSCISRC